MGSIGRQGQKHWQLIQFLPMLYAVLQDILGQHAGSAACYCYALCLFPLPLTRPDMPFAQVRVE